jgi:hypothetical protein
MSRLDDLVTAIAAQYGDGTVSFEAGKLAKARHGQQRRIIFQRCRGTLKFSVDGGRTAFGTPVSDAGTVTERRFAREEEVEITLRGEDEEALDLMFDRLVNSIFEIAGPNAFTDASDYEWVGDDSTDGGAYSARNPAIRFTVRLKLQSVSQPAPYVTLTDAEATVSEGDTDVAVTIP